MRGLAAAQIILRRAGITTWAWIVNHSIAAAAPDSPFLRARAVNELTEISQVQESNAARLAVVPLLPAEPVGIRVLRAVVDGRLAQVPAAESA